MTRQGKSDRTATTPALGFRCAVGREDTQIVRRLAAATGFFAPAEVAVAVELVEERLRAGAASGYDFVFAQQDGQVAGYACYGAIPCTRGSYDLYWIVVDPRRQGEGIGRALLEYSEAAVRAQGGRRLYIETSARPQYEGTRSFYRGCGYREEAFLQDFYAPGDGKVIYGKVLDPLRLSEGG